MKREKIWGLIILALLALSALVVSGRAIRAGHVMLVTSHPTKYGLDIKGGVRAVLQVDLKNLPPGVVWDQETAARVRTTLENRINVSGVGEATVQPKGNDQFIIELPDVKNKDAVLQQLATTASMTFYYLRDVQSARDPGAPLSMQETPDAKGKKHTTFFVVRPWHGLNPGQSFRDGAQVKADFTALLNQGTDPRPGATLYAVPSPLSANLPPGTPIYFMPTQQAAAAGLNTELTAWNTFLTQDVSPRILGGADILPNCQAQLGGTLGADPIVTQNFNATGARAMGSFTRAHMHEFMGIVLDDAMIEAPEIQGTIEDQGEISGGFRSLAEAQSLANLLNAGALPVSLQQVQVQSVEASLGVGAVHKSVVAGLVGLALVLVFMLLYYRLPGLVADIALLIYAMFTLAIFKGGLAWLGVPAVTLTLPGIAGFILSIGMAVDANILIFERLKEELRNGKSLRGAIDAGFKRAFTAIRDSNICTAITCIVLLSLGTASVRGFALTLLIGVIVSLFSAITVTRTLLYLLVDAGIGNNPALFGLNVRSLVGGTAQADATGARTGMNIIGRRRIFYMVSALIIVPGLIFWLGLHGLKRSIEFTGGSQIEVRYARPVSQTAVENAVKAADFTRPLPHVQMAEGGTDAIVSVAQRSPVPNPSLNPIYVRLRAALNVNGLGNTSPLPASIQEQVGNVGGVISAELTSRAVQAVFIAAALITLYLAAVFSIGGFVAGLRLGASAIAALLHDVLVLLGAFAIFGYFLNWEIDSLFVTAMLTVIGFSVHDTVVIFDRVRENLRHKARGEAFEPLVNRSINQTLARSLNTSFTVIMTLLALVIFGGQTTRLLNVALLIGIISGTYSSIFNAASILVDWENWLARRQHARAQPAFAGANGASTTAASLASNGGSARPLPAPKVPVAASRSDSFSRPATAAGVEDGKIRPKKKRPARRF